MSFQRLPYLLLALLVAVILLFAGCDPAKKALKQQQSYQALIDDYLQKNPPRIDTLTDYLPGQIIKVEVPLTVIDSAATARAKDSIQAALQRKYRHDAKECEQEINEAFEGGKAFAQAEQKKQTIEFKTPDTIRNTVTPTLYIRKLEQQVSNLQGQLIQCEKKQSWFWHFIFSAAAAVVLLVMLIITTAKK